MPSIAGDFRLYFRNEWRFFERQPLIRYRVPRLHFTGFDLIVPAVEMQTSIPGFGKDFGMRGKMRQLQENIHLRNGGDGA